jgi:kynureninase
VSGESRGRAREPTAVAEPAGDPLLAWRAQFPILARSTYMISNSLGAMPRGVYGALRAYADMWSTRGVRAWDEGWWEMGARVADLLGGLLGAAPGTLSMHPNVTLAEAVILSCFDFDGPRRKIVYEDLNFPSVRYLYQALRDRGAEIVVVPSRDGITIEVEDLLAAIDERTLLVPVSHAIYKSAFVQDAAAIAERAARVGAHVVLDVYQSAGTVPVDLDALGVSFAVGGSIKWLCGGPGAGYLYVRPDLLASLAPRLTGWMAHVRPFGFEPELDRRTDAYRFLNGTPSIPNLYIARVGYRILREVGVAAVREKSLRQTARLMDLADELGLPVRTPRDPARRGGTVSLDVPRGLDVARELNRRDVVVDYRPGAGVRLSPHFYSTDEECEHAVRELAAVAASR